MHPTGILVTHDQVEAMSLSDRVVVMNQGRIEQCASPRELYQNPKTDFVAQFVGAANLFKGKILDAKDGDDETVCRVGVNGMVLSVRHGSNAIVGTACTVAIHPEIIQLFTNTAATSDKNSFVGTIRAVYFLGGTQEVVIDVCGIDLRAIEFRGENLVVGAPVRVHIPTTSIILIMA
jgi:ABC-type Fe3+/spermidine/putrescine transport system ATPase subunit